MFHIVDGGRHAAMSAICARKKTRGLLASNTSIVTIVSVLALLLANEAAHAACTPAAASNVNAICSGTTINQGGGAPGTSAGFSGYGTGVENNLGITVVSGATVSGPFAGVEFNTGTVTNYGAVSGFNYGIFAGGTATVINDGTISATNGIGIFSLGTAAVTNRGTISAEIYAITAFNATTVTNSGIISVGAGGTGIYTFGPTTVTNSGTISGGALGIVTYGATFVNNSGIISGRIDGIVTYGAITLVNNGVISGDFFGVAAFTGPANVINSGTIISGGAALPASSGTGTVAGPAALQFSAAADTLTLLPGSRIIGAIDMGGGADVVNFIGGGRGPSGVVTLNNFTGTINASSLGQPLAVSANQIATVDPTSFAMADRNLMDFTRGVSSVIGDRFGAQAENANGGNTATGFAPDSVAASPIVEATANIPGLAAYASDAIVFKSPTAQYADGMTVWARGFAGHRVQQADDTTLRTLNRYYGDLVGGDWQARPDLRLGAFIGAGRTQSDIDLNSGNSASDLFFGGVFGHYAWGRSFVAMALQAGYSHTSTTRTIASNLAPGGLETAKASSNSWYLNPEVTVGHEFALGSMAGASYALTPKLQVRYLYGAFGGYTESGSPANLTAGRRAVSDFEERGQIDLTRTQVFAPAQVLKTSIYGGVLGDQRVGGTTVNVTLLGQPIPFAAPGKNSVWGGFGGAGFEWRSGRVSTFAAAEYFSFSDSSSIVSGKGGVRIAF